MAEGDKLQHEIDAEKADNNSYSGQSADAQNKRYFGNASGSAKYENLDGYNNRKEDKKNLQTKHKNFQTYLSLQIAAIEHDLSRLNKMMDKYQNEMDALKARATEVDHAIDMNEETKRALAKYTADGKGRLDILKENYGDKVLTSESGNFWDAMQKNHVTDPDGNLVYRDKNHNLYRLEIDPETGEPVKDPETGLPQRIYYDPVKDADIIADAMHQAYAEVPPKLFGNETIKSLDPTNTIKDEHNAWIKIQIDGKNVVTPPNNEKGAADITIAQANKICDATGQCLKTERLEITKNMEKTQKQIDATQKQIDAKQDQLDDLKEKQQRRDLSPDEQRRLKELEDKIEEQKLEKQELEDKYQHGQNEVDRIDDLLKNLPQDISTPDSSLFFPASSPLFNFEVTPEMERAKQDGINVSLDNGQSSLKGVFKPAAEGASPAPKSSTPKPENQPQSYTNSFNSFANPELQGTTTYGPALGMLSPEAIKNGGYTLEQKDGTQTWVNPDGSTMSMEDKIKEYEAEHGPLKEGMETTTQNSIVFQNNF